MPVLLFALCQFHSFLMQIRTPLTRDWCHPQWARSINYQQFHTDMPKNQSDLANSPLSFRAIFDCEKVKVKQCLMNTMTRDSPLCRHKTCVLVRRTRVGRGNQKRNILRNTQQNIHFWVLKSQEDPVSMLMLSNKVGFLQVALRFFICSLHFHSLKRHREMGIRERDYLKMC